MSLSGSIALYALFSYDALTEMDIDMYNNQMSNSTSNSDAMNFEVIAYKYGRIGLSGKNIFDAKGIE